METTKKKMKIVIAEDNQMVREGLCSLLNQQPDMQVVGEAGDGDGAVRLVSELSPDVVILEVAMPNLNGIEATRQIQAANGKTKVIALTMHAERPIVAKMLRVGATGYLLKDCAFEDLVAAVRAVTANHAYLSAEVTYLIIEHYVRNSTYHEQSALDTLTPREREVLQLVTEGHPTKKIANRLNLSTKTIEFHRHSMMKKLDIHSVAELTKYAVREGITNLDG